MGDKYSFDIPPMGDPTLRYAVQHGLLDPKLVEICLLDKTKWDSSMALHSYEVFENAAKNGSEFAMCICSHFSLIGIGLPISKKLAFEWAEKAALEKYPPGYFQLGTYLQNGVGTSADIEKAHYYYVHAADAGFGYAAAYLATGYHAGMFGRPDIAKALENSERGYELKEPMAPLQIAGWYENGEGVNRNFREAVKWYERAAELGNFFASDRLKRAYELGQLGLSKNRDFEKKYAAMFDAQIKRCGVT